MNEETKKIRVKVRELAREVGFDQIEPCDCGGFPECICDYTENRKDQVYYCEPEVLNDWLRENHKLYVQLTPTCTDDHLAWKVQVYQLKVWNATYSNFMPRYITSGHDYDEMFEQGLKAALTQLKKEK